jgi:hypothetical protein
MARREQIRPRRARSDDTGGAPESDPRVDAPSLPRPDTRAAAQLLDRIRRVLTDGRAN